MKPNQITRQHPLNQMIPNRQRPPKIPRRKRRMQRKPNRALFPLLADAITEEAGQEHEMVVVDPDKTALCGDFGDFVGEELVYFFVGLPGAVVESYAGLVVENWPEDGVYSVYVLVQQPLAQGFGVKNALEKLL